MNRALVPSGAWRRRVLARLSWLRRAARGRGPGVRRPQPRPCGRRRGRPRHRRRRGVVGHHRTDAPAGIRSRRGARREHGRCGVDRHGLVLDRPAGPPAPAQPRCSPSAPWAPVGLHSWPTCTTATDGGRRSSPGPSHPVLICNPWSGGGKVERFRLVAGAEEMGVEVVMLDHGLDLETLAGN